VKSVSLVEAEYTAHQLARELMDYGEPVADFNTRYPGKLEGCLEAPFTHINGRYVYWTLAHRAAVLFYSIIKNHPFENGNKRMAVTITLVFVFKNDRWIDISPEDLYKIATVVAKSRPIDHDEVIKTLKITFKQNLSEA